MHRESGGGGGGCSSPHLGSNLFHKGNFSKRKMGSTGNFSDSSPDLPDRKLAAPLNLKFSCAHGSKVISSC